MLLKIDDRVVVDQLVRLARNLEKDLRVLWYRRQSSQLGTGDRIFRPLVFIAVDENDKLLFFHRPFPLYLLAALTGFIRQSKSLVNKVFTVSVKIKYGGSIAA